MSLYLLNISSEFDEESESASDVDEFMTKSLRGGQSPTIREWNKFSSRIKPVVIVKRM